MQIMNRLWIVAALAALAWWDSSALRAAPSFTSIGDLPGGLVWTEPLDVSADGSVVVGSSWSSDGHEAIRWTLAEGMHTLGTLFVGERAPEANSVSANGVVVVGYSGTPQHTNEAFRWTEADGMVGIGDLPGGINNSSASSVSADGSVIVGTSHSALGTEAFRWTQESGMQGLGGLAGGNFYSNAYDVSADGSVVTGSSRNIEGNEEAYRWTESGGMQGLGHLPGGDPNSNSYGISSDGSTIVGNSLSALGTEAFRWTQESGMQGLGDLPGGAYHGVAFASSSDGSIVVGHSVGDTGGDEAFIWDADHGMRNLQEVLETDYGMDLPAWTLTTANSISDDGKTIVGAGSNPAGQYQGWIAQLGPWCDFNGNSVCNVSDIDLMFQQGDLVAGVAATVATEKFDLNSDNTINQQDIDVWLDVAATKNGYGSPYLRGDTDGLGAVFPDSRDVDLADYNNLASYFDPTGSLGPHPWDHGNFDGDGDVDLADYNTLAGNFHPAGYGAAAVPEPAAVVLVLAGLLAVAGAGCWRH